MNLKNQKLFDFFADNHELSLLESEMTDIVDVVKSVITPTWVSVNDRLPTHIYSVLAYVVDGGFAKYGEPMIDIVAYNPQTGEWLQNVGDAGDEVVTVTHWMDLPYEPDVSVRWMPIETAPTDGTQILLMKMPLRDQVKMAVADGFMANGRWVWPYVHKEPTHWMPMLTAH